MHPALDPTDILAVIPWTDAPQAGPSYDPRSAYVEEFWLSILGPSTTWLARRLAAGFDAYPEGFELDVTEAARSLGLGDRGGRHSPFWRSVNRLLMFDVASAAGPATIAVRGRLPRLNHRQLGRLSPERYAAHEGWPAADG